MNTASISFNFFSITVAIYADEICQETLAAACPY
jgi:hypothetical protein